MILLRSLKCDYNEGRLPFLPLSTIEYVLCRVSGQLAAVLHVEIVLRALNTLRVVSQSPPHATAPLAVHVVLSIY